MSFLKYALVASSLLMPALSQGDSAAPTFAQITQGPGPGGNCNGCYVVADVAAIVFGTEFVTQLNTEVVQVQTGKNGSYVATSTIVGSAQLSISPSGGVGGNTYSLNNSPTITLGGQPLTSPTAYQVFTAYSVTSSFVNEEGQCTTVFGQKVIPPSFYKFPIPASPGPDYVQSIELSFISDIGFVSCSGGGMQVETTSVNSGSVLTTTSTSIGPLRFTPQPVVAPTVQTPTLTPNFPITSGVASTGVIVSTGNYSTMSFATYSIVTGGGPSLSTSFSQATLPLMAAGALTILIGAALL